MYADIEGQKRRVMQREIRMKMHDAIKATLINKQKELDELKRLRKEEELRLELLTKKTEPQ